MLFWVIVYYCNIVFEKITNPDGLVEAKDRSGGMALLWQSDIKILEIHRTSFAIESRVQDPET